MNLPNVYPNQTLRIQPFSTSEIHAEISPFCTNQKDKNKMVLKMVMDINTCHINVDEDVRDNFDARFQIMVTENYRLAPTSRNGYQHNNCPGSTDQNQSPQSLQW